MRDSVGHIHYYTKAVAEKMVQDAGYAIVSSEYSNAWKNSPNLSWAGKIARIFRWTLNKISPTLNAKIFGGETLILIAKPNT
jgi:hypothetical protein